MEGVLVSQRAAFEETLTKAGVERNELERELEQIRAERQQLEAQLAQSDTEVAGLRSQIVAKDAELSSIEIEVDDLRDQLTDAQRAGDDAALIADLRRQLAAKQRQIDEQSGDLETLQDKWRSAESQAALFKQQLDQRAVGENKYPAQSEARIAALQQDILDVSGQRDRALQAIGEEGRQKELLRQQREVLKRQLAELSDEFDVQINALNAEIQARDQEILARDDRIRRLKMDVSEMKLAADRLRIEGTIGERFTNNTRGPREPPFKYRRTSTLDNTVITLSSSATGSTSTSTISRPLSKTLMTSRFCSSEAYGFDEVDVRTNLTRDAMYSLLNELKPTGKDEFVLIYYAGHGTADEFDNGYWTPVDYVPGKNPATTALPVAQITQHLNMMQAKHVMVIARNSCYSGALLRDNTIEIQNVDQRLKHWVNNASRTVLTSGGFAPVLDVGGDGRHSVFANAFIDVLADNAGILSGEALHARIRDRIRTESLELELEQTPQFAGLGDAGHKNGQFVFVPRAEPQARLAN